MSRDASSRVLLALTGLALAAALAGCGGDDAAGPSAEGSSTAPTTSATSPATSTATSPPSSATVAPAAGPPVTMKTFTYAGPDGWQVKVAGPFSTSVFDPDPAHGAGLVHSYDLTSFSTETLDSVARSQLKVAKAQGIKASRVQDRSVAGVPGFVLEGSSGLVRKFYEYGTIRNGRNVAIIFTWERPPADADQVVESVLATIQFS